MDTTIKQSLKEIVGAENFTDSLINNAKLRVQKFKIFTTTQFLNQLVKEAG